MLHTMAGGNGGNDHLLRFAEIANGKRLRPAMTGFMIFVAQNAPSVRIDLSLRFQIRASNKEASDVAIGQLLYDQWKQLDKSELERYESLSLQDQEARKRAKGKQ